jgi:hypothetical protein
MSVTERGREGSQRLPSFHGEVEAFPDEEASGTPTALAMAIAEAAMKAAEYLTEQGIPEARFEVSRIQITVKKNPGPTSYGATISHGGP